MQNKSLYTFLFGNMTARAVCTSTVPAYTTFLRLCVCGDRRPRLKAWV